MSRLLQALPATAVVLLAALAPGAAGAVIHVPVVNPGFDEDPIQSPGANQPTISGWDTSAGGGDGIFRPTLSDYPSGIPSGQNAAYANLPGNRVRQVLTTRVAPNTTYVLKVAVGWNNNDPFAGYRVQLRVDGSTVLAEDNSSKTPEQGGWVTSTVVYTSPEGLTGGVQDPVLGKPLEIWLLAKGIQANFDSVELVAYPANASACSEVFFLPFYLVDKEDPSGTTTLFAVRNLTGGAVLADVEYFTPGGTSQRKDLFELDAFETRTVNLRDVLGLATDPDGFARGFVRVVAGGSRDGTPVLAGDFFQIDVGNDFATGEELVRLTELCGDASIRFLDFGVGTLLRVFVTQPRGDVPALDPPSFTVQVYDESGNEVGPPQPFWTADHVVELSSSDLTAITFGTFRFDLANGLGGTVYAEYSAQGRFSVGVSPQCDGSRPCDEGDCCPPGAPKAQTPPLHYPEGAVSDGVAIDNCEAALADALRSLNSFHYRNACQQAHGGELPDEVLGARVVECRAAPPGFDSGIVVFVEACCPLPE